MTEVIPAPKGFTFGCDPEVFIVNAWSGEFVSAAGIIPGTKCQPHPVKQGAVQVDGMAAEFNIDPASSFEEFRNNIETVIGELKTFLPKGHDLCWSPYVRFKPEVFDAAPDEAKILGCDPDFNAWTGAVNPPPDCEIDPYLRTAAGHLHIGWATGMEMGNVQHIMNCRDLVKQMDWLLGAWSLFEDPDDTRRRLYGKAGAFRPKPYGVEYRVLSNFWLKSPDLMLQTWNRMTKAIYQMKDHYWPDQSRSNDYIIRAINTGELFSLPAKFLEYPIRTINELDILEKKVKPTSKTSSQILDEIFANAPSIMGASTNG